MTNVEVMVNINDHSQLFALISRYHNVQKSWCRQGRHLEQGDQLSPLCFPPHHHYTSGNCGVGQFFPSIASSDVVQQIRLSTAAPHCHYHHSNHPSQNQLNCHLHLHCHQHFIIMCCRISFSTGLFTA